MKTSRVVLSVLLIASFAFFIAACKKSSSTSTDNTTKSTQTASNNALGEQLYDNVKDWSDQAMAAHSLKSSLLDTVFMGTCVLATLDLTTMPYKLVINFGASKCLCWDGYYRRGKIICTFNGPYWQQGTIITYTFENYAVNDNQVMGTKVVTNMGRNASQHMYWTVVVSGQVIKANNGGTLTWNSNRTIEWTVGDTTPFVPWDDVFQITGTATGTNPDNTSYTCTIVLPLVKKINCQWLVSGSIDIQITSIPLITVDYGGGSCDNQATATFNGQVYPISMP